MPLHRTSQPAETVIGQASPEIASPFAKTATEQLLRSYRFQVNDNGTATMQQECRRLYLIQEIGAELRRRNVEAA